MTTQAIRTIAAAPSIHTYFDVCPESPDGRFLTWFAFDGQPLQRGTVMIAPRDGGEPVAVATCSATPHGGAQAGWLDNEHIYFSADGQVQVAHVSGRIVQTVAGAIDTIHQGSRRGLVHSNCWRKTGGTPPKEQACYRVDLDSGATVELLDRERAYALLGQHLDLAQVPIEAMNFKHTKWAPDGRRWFVVFTNEEYKKHQGDRAMPRVKSILVADDQGGDLLWLGEFGHHPNWTPDARGIYAYAGGDGQVMRWSADGGEPALLYRLPIEGHPCISPDGCWLVSDFRRQGETGLVLVDLVHGSHETLLCWKDPKVDWQTLHPRGCVCHAHPVWSCDSKRIYFNAIVGDLPQLQVIER